MRRSLLLLVLCLASIASACSAAQEGPEAAPGAVPPSRGSGSNEADDNKEASAPEEPAPDFSVTTFEGETFALGEQRGTPVVLNFWESW